MSRPPVDATGTRTPPAKGSRSPTRLRFGWSVSRLLWKGCVGEQDPTGRKSQSSITVGSALPALLSTIALVPTFLGLRYNPVRQAILEHVTIHPGTSRPMVQEALGLSRGSVTHHLAILEAAELVRSVSIGRRLHFFAAGEPAQTGQHVALRHERRRAIAEFVLHNPGCTQRDLALALALPPSRVHGHVGHLADVGLLTKHGSGRLVRLEPTAHLVQRLADTVR